MFFCWIFLFHSYVTQICSVAGRVFKLYANSEEEWPTQCQLLLVRHQQEASSLLYHWAIIHSMWLSLVMVEKNELMALLSQLLFAFLRRNMLFQYKIREAPKKFKYQPRPQFLPGSVLFCHNIWNLSGEPGDGILEWCFKSNFLGINSSLLRLEFLSGFLPSFFNSTKCYSREDSSFLVSRIFCEVL